MARTAAHCEKSPRVRSAVIHTERTIPTGKINIKEIQTNEWQTLESCCQWFKLGKSYVLVSTVVVIALHTHFNGIPRQIVKSRMKSVLKFMNAIHSRNNIRQTYETTYSEKQKK